MNLCLLKPLRVWWIPRTERGKSKFDRTHNFPLNYTCRIPKLSQGGTTRCHAGYSTTGMLQV